jgi:predicted alpha/beta hydrolase family esterase
MMTPAYLIHGYGANPAANWFPWLQRKAEQELQQALEILPMPNPNQPDPDAWDQLCHQEIVAEDGLTIIGHSLGCITALRFIMNHHIKNITLILVSGFDETVHTLPQLASFTDLAPDYTKILPKIKAAVVISAVDDAMVPYVYSETLARHLQCKFVLLPTGKHFIGSEGVTNLPEVYEQWQALRNQTD